MIEQQVTTLHFVPSILQAFLQEPEVSVCGSLRQVFCSGEALSLELQTRFFTTFPDRVQLHNLYGPTEASIEVTSWPCQCRVEAGPQPSHRVPIGRPIANTQIYLLDRYLQPVPIGVVGEVYIGGVGLARGYFNRPGLTAERFIPNPFVGTSQRAQGTVLTAPDLPGTRLYRTGDLACYRVDGALEFLGRRDHQVKLRGNRIELGEIETVLGQHEAIQECIVLVREDEVGEKRLVAYPVVKPGQPMGQAHRLLVSELRFYLQARLPAYMVPSAFVPLEALPLMPNGKVDRKALAVLDLVQISQNEGRELPDTPLQELLGQIWKEVLVAVPSSGSRKDLGSCSLPPGKVYPPNPNGSSGNALGVRTQVGIHENFGYSEKCVEFQHFSHPYRVGQHRKSAWNRHRILLVIVSLLLPESLCRIGIHEVILHGGRTIFEYLGTGRLMSHPEFLGNLSSILKRPMLEWFASLEETSSRELDGGRSKDD